MTDNTNQYIYSVASAMEANSLVVDMIRQGKNNRDILKTSIMVNGEKYPLNVAKITKIKKEHSQDLAEKEKHHDADYFELFEQGMTVNQVVVYLKCSFEEADEAFSKFLKHSRNVLVPSDTLKRIFEEIARVAPDCNNPREIVPIMSELVDEVQEFRMLKAPCYFCNNPVQFGAQTMEEITPILKKIGFAHQSCIDENQSLDLVSGGSNYLSRFLKSS